MFPQIYQVIQVVTPAFLVIGVGYFFQSKIGGDVKSLSRLTMSTVVPAFALKNIYEMNLEGFVVGSVLASAIIIIIFPGFLAWLVLKNNEKRGIYLPIMFMNTINLPFPILIAAYGTESIPYALMFYFTTFIGIFTVGLVIVSGAGNGARQVFKESVFWVLILAFLIRWTGIVLPELIMNPINLLSQATVPIVLLVLGMQLAHVEITDMRLTLFAVSFRIIGGLIAALFCVWIFQLEGLPLKVVILVAIMPSAIINFLVTQKYQANPRVVASTILVSTLVSIIIIPLALLILG